MFPVLMGLINDYEAVMKLDEIDPEGELVTQEFYQREEEQMKPAMAELSDKLPG